MKWEREKEKFLGTKTERAFLYNDEVNAQVMSPKTYQFFAHPYEQKLADFYSKGIFYFHSCGDITPFLDTISTIRGLRKLHISPVTDFRIAARKLRGTVVFQKRMDPVKDLELCDTTTMESRIKEVLGVGYPMELDPGPIQTAPLEKIKTWIHIARKTIKSHAWDPSSKVAKELTNSRGSQLTNYLKDRAKSCEDTEREKATLLLQKIFGYRPH